MRAGETISWERSFTEEDVQGFAELSGDRGGHHLARDQEGRIMVHGLLTATLPTKIGGDINFIAREMNFNFLKPVFVGDAIRCSVRFAEVDSSGKHIRLFATISCVNQRGEEVLTGTTRGIIKNPKS